MEKIQATQAMFSKIALKIRENKYLNAISTGLMSIMVLMIVGSIATLIASVQWVPWQNVIEASGLRPFLLGLNNMTNGLIAVFATFAIAYQLGIGLGKNPFNSAILSLMVFLTLTPTAPLYEMGELGGNAIPFQWLGATGLFSAIVIALLTTIIYSKVVDKGWIIKMPDGVPPMISNSFSALIPGFIIAIIAIIVRMGLSLTEFGYIHNVIFRFVATPLTNVGSNPIAVTFAVFISAVLWFFGIHGMNILLATIQPILMPLQLENLAAFEAGYELPNMIVWQNVSLFGNLGGSGSTIGLVFAMVWFAKSKQYKTLGKIALAPTLFGINEPILFGFPLVLNFKTIVPFILTPVLIFATGIALIYIGILPRATGVLTPLGTPIIISGFIAGGYRYALFQVAGTVVSFFMYSRVFLRLDKEAVAREKGK